MATIILNRIRDSKDQSHEQVEVVCENIAYIEPLTMWECEDRELRLTKPRFSAKRWSMCDGAILTMTSGDQLYVTQDVHEVTRKRVNAESEERRLLAVAIAAVIIEQRSPGISTDQI